MGRYWIPDSKGEKRRKGQIWIVAHAQHITPGKGLPRPIQPQHVSSPCWRPERLYCSDMSDPTARKKYVKWNEINSMHASGSRGGDLCMRSLGAAEGGLLYMHALFRSG